MDADERESYMAFVAARERYEQVRLLNQQRGVGAVPGGAFGHSHVSPPQPSQASLQQLQLAQLQRLQYLRELQQYSGVARDISEAQRMHSAALASRDSWADSSSSSSNNNNNSLAAAIAHYRASALGSPDGSAAPDRRRVAMLGHDAEATFAEELARARAGVGISSGGEDVRPALNAQLPSVASLLGRSSSSSGSSRSSDSGGARAGTLEQMLAAARAQDRARQQKQLLMQHHQQQQHASELQQLQREHNLQQHAAAIARARLNSARTSSHGSASPESSTATLLAAQVQLAAQRRAYQEAAALHSLGGGHIGRGLSVPAADATAAAAKAPTTIPAPRPARPVAPRGAASGGAGAVTPGVRKVRKWRKSGNFSSKYRGVTFQKRDSRYIARAWIDKKIVHLGTFQTEEEAARIVRLKYMEVYGEVPGMEDEPPLPGMKELLLRAAPRGLSESATQQLAYDLGAGELPPRSPLRATRPLVRARQEPAAAAARVKEENEQEGKRQKVDGVSSAQASPAAAVTVTGDDATTAAVGSSASGDEAEEDARNDETDTAAQNEEADADAARGDAADGADSECAAAPPAAEAEPV